MEEGWPEEVKDYTIYTCAARSADEKIKLKKVKVRGEGI